MSDLKLLLNLSNDEVIEKHLERFSSKGSIATRRSCLNYFFGKDYFGFNGNVKDVTKSIIVDYFDYLNKLTSIGLKAKKTKWAILKSFLQFCMEYYDDFLVVIPKPNGICKWQKVHKASNSNKDVVLTLEEVEKILHFLKLHHFKYYLIFRTFAETGMRKGELINIDFDKVNLEKRTIETLGKTGEKVYYFRKEFVEYLKVYLSERKTKNITEKALFLSTQLKRYSDRVFNIYLNKIVEKCGITEKITCHTFRRTINTLRKNMGCSIEDRKILINHQVRDVNYESYTKLKYSEFIALYDKWNPYLNANL